MMTPAALYIQTNYSPILGSAFSGLQNGWKIVRQVQAIHRVRDAEMGKARQDFWRKGGIP
jgi:hypothetical protein